MTWKEVGNTVRQYAPKLGKLLTNPVGGAIDIGASIISDALGTQKEPDAVMLAIESDPNAAVKLKQTEVEKRAEISRALIESETEALRIVNKTIGRELDVAKSGTDFSKFWASFWRPFWGVVSALAFIFQVGGNVWLVSDVIGLIHKGEIADATQVLTALGTINTTLMPLWAVPGAILGVTAWHRGQMQRAEAGEQKGPGIFGALAQRVTGK